MISVSWIPFDLFTLRFAKCSSASYYLHWFVLVIMRKMLAGCMQKKFGFGSFLWTHTFLHEWHRLHGKTHKVTSLSQFTGQKDQNTRTQKQARWWRLIVVQKSSKSTKIVRQNNREIAGSHKNDRVAQKKAKSGYLIHTWGNKRKWNHQGNKTLLKKIKNKTGGEKLNTRHKRVVK